jgi:hypothetical protein
MAADLGQPISVVVTGSAVGYEVTSKTSASTSAIGAGSFATTPVPVISGTVTTGSTLSVTTGTWAPVQDSFAYQWSVGGVPVATTATYVIKAADVGSTITVTLTAKKAGFTDTSKTSAATAPVTLPLIAGVPTPTITGTVKVGNTLTAVPGTLSGATVKSYQWQSASTASGTYADISNATAKTYVLTATDVGKFLKVTVVWQKSGSGDTPKQSAATAAVASGTFAAAIVPTITGTKTVGQILTAAEGTWSPSADSFKYVWKSASTASGTYTAISGATGKTYTLKPTDKGKFVKVEVTAVKAGYTSLTGSSVATSAIQ